MKKTARTYIEEQIRNNGNVVTQSPQGSETTHSHQDSNNTLGKRVASKCADGDIRAALRILTSLDTVIRPSAEVEEELRRKHPAAPDDETLPPHTSVDPNRAPTVDREKVSSSLKNMSSGSAAGLDGIRPLHLKQLVSPETSEAGHRLMTSITRLLNLIMRGQVPSFAREAIFGASLFALGKNDGGVRPIAVGSVYRRLAARILTHYAAARLSQELAPVQLGVGVSQGCEAAVHAVREYARVLSGMEDSSYVLVKVDVKNAFNSLRRDVLLNRIAERCPELHPMASHAYSTQTPLFFGESVIPSLRGVQQGDPIGPLAFALAIDPIIRSESDNGLLKVWYLDDGCLVGTAEQVARELSRIREGFSASLGLELNPEKCEIAYLGASNPSLSQAAVSIVRQVMPEIVETSLEELSLLGSPLQDGGLQPTLRSAASLVSLLCERLQSLDAHLALFFLSHFVSVPRLTYLLRTSPTYKERSSLADIDECVRTALTRAVNVDIAGDAWEQAALPVDKGGLGIRRVSDLAEPCFLASLSASASLIGQICPSIGAAEELESFRSAREAFVLRAGVSSPPEGEAMGRQKAWSDLAADASKERMLSSANQIHRARLLAACSAHSAAWSQALPVSSLGLHLDNETVRVAVSLRLGARISQPHRCRCGKQSDALGHHGLSCKYSEGRLPRHSNLNDVVKRALASAGVPSTPEPVGLDSRDGRRPDGLTVFPFSRGRSLCWDATCVDTFSGSNLPQSALRSGAAAEAAEGRKRNRYAHISERFRFEPLAVETTGVLGPSTIKFVTELGRRVRERTGEYRETQWLLQRISVAVARGNAAAVLASGRAVHDR